MKLEKAVGNLHHELCFLLNAENDAEFSLLELIDVQKGYIKWHDGRIALRTKFCLEKDVK